MVTNTLEVGILIQHRVVDVQEKVKRVLVQKVHLEKKTGNDVRLVCIVRKFTSWLAANQC